jgi:hypothetical protein
MAHIPDEDLKKILLPDQTREFLNENPHLYRRVAKFQVEFAVEFAGKAAAHEIERVKEKFLKSIGTIAKTE